METRQLEYILKIAEEKSVTRAAEQLFVTQSALSQQLQKLEQELGAPLFTRTKGDWSPTPEGEVYLESAREILRIKQNAYALIGDMAGKRRSTLSVGITPGRGTNMFAEVYPRFIQKFPGITIEPRELSVKRQQEEIRKGTLNLGFMTLLESQKGNDEYLPLFEEELYLAVPERYPEQLLCPGESEAVALENVRNEPFVLMYRESTQRELTDAMFARAGFTPHVLMETASNQTVLSMIRARLCVGIIPYHYVRQKPEGVRFYPLTQHPTWTVYACYRRGGYLTKAAREFLSLAKEFWTK